MTEIDEIDRALLNRIQSDFPLVEHPFAAIGEELGVGEAEVIARVRRLKQDDVIRRIGGNFVPDKVGFVSTLCAAEVPPERIEAFTQVVNRFGGVTHNYLRDHRVNVWFTFIAPSMDEIESHLEAIRRETGVSEIHNLPATRVFKIRAQFDLELLDN
ncbi:MAG TPA: Lrp/AsnC family transcriptional regulator [Desulfobacteraceae bacterium]|nr:AsnC family transcriptional regulator [Deltaproteobacteria bacterium]RLB98312.1 MAG: Lrp/AsnC family transcriptional regulator [Deltaproteobacteria bacterium]HDI60639.1 Lrp/AsnC family transcriptional regulator [Desulfobacteraceae bacterium]